MVKLFQVFQYHQIDKFQFNLMNIKILFTQKLLLKLNKLKQLMIYNFNKKINKVDKFNQIFKVG